MSLPPNEHDQNHQEILVKIVRQSIWVLIKHALAPVIGLLLAAFLLFPLFYWGTPGIVIFSGWFLFMLLTLVRHWVGWYHTTLTITNHRLIDQDQPGLFTRSVSEEPIAAIVEVLYKVKGVWQTMTRTGTVYISLKDTPSKIVIFNIPQPKKVQQLLLDLRQERHQPPSQAKQTNHDGQNR